MLELLKTALIFATPLILAAMGGYASERSGVINIGLEGLMLTAGCVAAIASGPFGAVGALLLAIVVTVLLSLLHWLITQKYHVDHVISGMAINLLAAGGTNYAASLASAGSTQIKHLPVGFYEAVAVLLPFGLWAYTRWTRGGLRLLATGSDPDKARLAGIVPEKIRFVSLAATGLFSALGGAMLVAFTAGFTNDMTSGRGYIALAALVLGGWRPLPTLASCAVFGLLMALRVQYAGETILGYSPPSEFWAALPYLATVVALAGFLGRNRTPAGLGRP